MASMSAGALKPGIPDGLTGIVRPVGLGRRHADNVTNENFGPASRGQDLTNYRSFLMAKMS